MCRARDQCSASYGLGHVFQHSGQVGQAMRADVGPRKRSRGLDDVRSLSVVSLLEYCISLLCLPLISFDKDRCAVLSNYQN